MSIRIGLYDFFAYTLPGVFYLLIVAFGLVIFGFVKIDFQSLSNLSLFSFLLFLGGGYLVGLLLDPLAYRWGRLFQKRTRDARKLAFETFHNDHPWVTLNFKSGDWGILLRTIKSRSSEAAIDIEQHNVASIMLRNISFGLALIAGLYLLFFFVVSNSFWNLLLAGTSFGLSYTAIRRSKVRRHWFYIAILEAVVAQYLIQEDHMNDMAIVSIDIIQSERAGEALVSIASGEGEGPESEDLVAVEAVPSEADMVKTAEAAAGAVTMTNAGTEEADQGAIERAVDDTD